MTVYFESSWAILSSIGLGNVLIGANVIAIINVTPISLVPVVVSGAGALANGLCFYAYYADNPLPNTILASVLADICWMIQEAGISFYSYIVLNRILHNHQLTIFRSLFWSLILVILVMRISILTVRVKSFVSPATNIQRIINGLHVGYFTTIAALECISASFLLREFFLAKKASTEASLGPGLLQHLMHSTEIRMAILALIGTTRAIVYFFQASPQKSTNTASQVDRFVYTLECLFPVMLYIDILSSKHMHQLRTIPSLPDILSLHHAEPPMQHAVNRGSDAENPSEMNDGERVHKQDWFPGATPRQTATNFQWKTSDEEISTSWHENSASAFHPG